MFLYHYYDAKIGPFKNISDLSVDDAKQLLDEIRKERPDCQCAKRQESYVEDRIYYEDILRNEFLKKGGRIDRQIPHYMVVEHSPWLETWYENSSFVRIPIEEFDISTLSFTYGDSHPTFSSRVNDGKEYRKLEDCNAIFVTTNKDIRNETNKLLNLDVNFKISPVVSDMDLTAIVWLKSMINNKRLPEMKLTENAMAAIKPSSALRKKFHQSLSNLKTSKTDVTPETLYNLLCSNYYVEDLMINVNGDIKKINPGVLIDTYEETLKKNSLLTEQENKLSKENEELINQLLKKEENDKKYRRNVYDKYTKREKLIVNIIEITEKVLKIAICLLLFYLSYKQSNKPSPNTIISWFYIILGIYTLLCNFIPISCFQIFEYLFNKINEKIFITLNKHYTKVCEKEINTIFKVE